jgi:hypothetical protein
LLLPLISGGAQLPPLDNYSLVYSE